MWYPLNLSLYSISQILLKILFMSQRQDSSEWKRPWFIFIKEWKKVLLTIIYKYFSQSRYCKNFTNSKDIGSEEQSPVWVEFVGRKSQESFFSDICYSVIVLERWPVYLWIPYQAKTGRRKIKLEVKPATFTFYKVLYQFCGI